MQKSTISRSGTACSASTRFAGASCWTAHGSRRRCRQTGGSAGLIGTGGNGGNGGTGANAGSPGTGGAGGLLLGQNGLNGLP
ncbi:hypothetical protein FVP45_03115 [Mycobacterium tuberculosis]|nr:hypothetical protein [Mycobacterium tuberculosis]